MSGKAAKDCVNRLAGPIENADAESALIYEVDRIIPRVRVGVHGRGNWDVARDDVWTAARDL